MKNNMFYLLFIPLIVLILLVLLILETHLNDEEEIKIVEEDLHKSNILYYDNTIYLDYDDLNNFNIAANEVINYSISLNNIVDKLMQKDKSIKLYSEKDNKVLETLLAKEDANKIFGDYLNIKDDVTVKVLFKDAEDNQEVEDIDFKINREEILRTRVVKTAQEQLENTGEKYWEWYGFNHRVEWCCVFVSWVAEQHGLIEEGKVPKFIWVKKGVDFYKERNQWKYPNEYTPKGGDIIFYDWNNNEVIDHVGIVEKVENGYVYAIEGNVGYTHVKRKKYKLSSSYIYGYGIPAY
ncbi:MAG: CHAP domain-containing protein [Bacilli bacterium]